jgi:AhpD family alkylhydroperoxidase
VSDELTQKADALIERMKKDRGYFVEAYNTLYRAALNDGRALSARTRELIAIGILSYRGDVASVTAHIRRAMRLGASKQEILEAVETSIIPGGAPTFFNGLSAIIKAVEDAAP